MSLITNVIFSDATAIAPAVLAIYFIDGSMVGLGDEEAEIFWKCLKASALNIWTTNTKA